ncbi:hypothetical protein AGMMS49545_06140 [Betaproteobacteria bacterium]|nr:hypothetical protein AGMMS49545_06140 [Betaproteobacteria bacterium]GHU49029.1 hypothetical protein AGMMS50289_26060 [Betaproteobacteria bacterium]
MNQLFGKEFGISYIRLPLKESANITHGNALTMDWEKVIPKKELSFIMGNPPFVGYSNQSAEQKADILSVYLDAGGKPFKTSGKIDYVAAWYYKAAHMMARTPIRTAFVSTNSITQGEQVAAVWKPLFGMFGVHIDFGYKTFKWSNEARGKAAVHCVIAGFSVMPKNGVKNIYDSDGTKITVKNINPYLVDAQTVFVESKTSAICDVPPMVYGNKPADGGHLFVESNEYNDFIAREPSALKYIRKILGSEEFINNKNRWCLWLVDASPADLRKMPLVMARVEKCRQMRLASTKKATRESATTPALFQEIRQPDSQYIIVPRVSSERRRYIPMGFIDAQTIASDSVQVIPRATLYHFGILTSSVHMAWVRAICGRLKSDYRYSKDIVYNNFPWADASDTQKEKIETAAQAVLDARALFPESSLADLYDPLTMPPELQKAHQTLDKAVLQAYGFSSKDFTEADCVARLMERYQALPGAMAAPKAVLAVREKS